MFAGGAWRIDDNLASDDQVVYSIIKWFADSWDHDAVFRVVGERKSALPARSFNRTITLLATPRPETPRFASLLILSLGAVALISALLITQVVLSDVSGAVEARDESGASACRLVQIALDEGYSVSRVEERRICP
jgi:hypothetical protein